MRIDHALDTMIVFYFCITLGDNSTFSLPIIRRPNFQMSY